MAEGQPGLHRQPRPRSLKLAKLRIYFDAGTEDRYGFAVGNRLLHEALEKRDVEHVWRLIDGGGHSWGNRFQDKALPHSFAFVGEMFRKADRRRRAKRRRSR